MLQSGLLNYKKCQLVKSKQFVSANMLRLCLLALVALTALSDLSEGSAIRVERDACAELLTEFDSCGSK